MDFLVVGLLAVGQTSAWVFVESPAPPAPKALTAADGTRYTWREGYGYHREGQPTPGNYQMRFDSSNSSETPNSSCRMINGVMVCPQRR